MLASLTRLCRVFLIAGLIGVGVGCAALLGQSGPDDMALPIQRRVIPPQWVAKELEKVKKGTLLLMPLDEFDARLAKARKSLQAGAQKPRLTKAHYSAELMDGCFREGSGQWSIVHTGPSASVLPLAPISFAMRHPRWEQAGDAVLANFDGRNIGILAPPGGNHTCLFEWSARGTPTNDGIVFHLTIPPCPISTFEFTVPADLWLVAKEGTMVMGPRETGIPNKRLWKMQVTGAKSVDILVRKLTDPKGPAPTVFARITQNDQRVAPDRQEIDQEFQVDILHGSVRELTLVGDASLQPFDVTLKSGQVKSWSWQIITSKKNVKGKQIVSKLGHLAIQFEQPQQGKLPGLMVRSLAPAPTAGHWTSPSLHVLGALPRGEIVVIHLHPELAWGKWDNGSFQPTRMATQNDGTQVLTLAETAPSPGQSRRPNLVLLKKNLDLHTQEDYRWQIAPRSLTLSAAIRYAPLRGELFELRVKLPKTFPGYSIESLSMEPADMLGAWKLSGDILIVQLQHALAPGKTAHLKIELQSSFRPWNKGIHVVTYPELLPLDGTKREGAATFDVDPVFQTQLLRSSIPLAPPGPDALKSSSRAARYRFEFRDQRLSAAIRLVPQPVQVQLFGMHTLTLGESGARLRFHWRAEPLIGAPEHIDFRFAPGFPPTWKILDEDNTGIHHWERLRLQEALPHLLLLGSRDPFQAAAFRSMAPAGSYWRFHFNEAFPKKYAFTLEAEAPLGILENDWQRVSLRLPSPSPWDYAAAMFAADGLNRAPGDRVWSLPLMSPVQQRNVEQEITLESRQEPIAKVTGDGSLRVGPAVGTSEKAPLVVRLTPGDGAAVGANSMIQVRTHGEKPRTSWQELCDEARLTTFVYQDGRVFHRIQFRLWQWRDRNCELRLPEDITVVAVKVQDRWLQRLQTEHHDTQVRLTLPFDQNAEFVSYEILTRASANVSWLPGMIQARTPHIDWPIAPVDLRTRWFLERGLTPLNQEALAPVGVPDQIAGQTETPRRLRRAWTWGRQLWPYGESADLAKKLDDQKQVILLAEKQMRDTRGKATKLGEVLEQLTLNHLNNATALLVDPVAFRSLGLSPETAIDPVNLSPQAARPFWESLGLVYVSCPSGALLTSPARMRTLGIQTATQSVELDAAIRQGILHGQDSSSSFCLVLNWLGMAPEVEPFLSSGIAPHLSALPGDLPEMLEWTLVADAAATGSIYLVDPLTARAFGWLIALIAGLVWWRIGRTLEPFAGFRAYVVLFAIFIAIAVWLPMQVREFFAWPTLLLGVVGFVWHLVRYIGRAGQPGGRGISTVSHVIPTACLAGLLLLTATWRTPAQAQAPRPYTVLIMEGPKPSALVTPELNARLNALEKQVASVAPQAVLVSAKYSGKIKDTQALVTAVYQARSFADNTTLIIPLTGVHLQQGVFLDGSPVFPVPHKDGFSLPIGDEGPHELRLTFATRAVAGDSVKLLLAIPSLIQSELNLQWAAPVHLVQCLNCAGEEKFVNGPGNSVKEWQGQLGYASAVQLRWANVGAAGAPKSIEVKEAHFWDLRPASLSLISSMNYALGKKSLARLSVTVPEGLHVRSVEALATPPTIAPALPMVIQNWRVVGKGGQRRVDVDFVQPVTGNVTLNLDVVPTAFGKKNQLTLPLPAPIQAISVSGLLGYRLEAAEKSRAAPNLSVQGLSAENFEQQWKKHGAPAIPLPSVAYTFQRRAQDASLKLDIIPAARQARVQLQWDVDQHLAQLKGKVDIASANEELILLEFFVDPALTLAKVSGPDVGRWHLQQSMLQVWLQQPRKQTTIEISGWRKNSSKAPVINLAIPCVYPLHARLIDSSLEVRPASDIQVAPTQLRGLRAEAANKLRYSIDDVPYAASFHLTAAAEPPSASMLTKVQATDLGMKVWMGIRLTTPRGQLPVLKLRVKDWPHGALQLNAPGASVQSIGADRAAKVWVLRYPPRMPQSVFLVLHGRVDLGKQKQVALPKVEVEGAVIDQRWLAWKGVNIHPTPGDKKLVRLPADGARLVSLRKRWDLEDLPGWHVAEAPGVDLKASILKTPFGANVRILAKTDETRLAGELPWLHETSLWIHAPEAVELRFKFQAPIKTFCAMVEDKRVSAWNAGDREFVLPLDGRTEPRQVRLRWKSFPAGEGLAAPDTQPIQIDQSAPGTSLRILWIPPGMAAAQPDQPPAPTLLDRLLHEGECELRLTAALAQIAPRTADARRLIKASQDRLHACIRYAEYVQGILKSAAPRGDSSEGQKRLASLKSKNLTQAKLRQYDSEQKNAAKAPGFSRSALPTSSRSYLGLPMIVPPETAPVLRSAEELTNSERRTFSELLLLVAVFLFVFSYFRQAWRVLRVVSLELVIGVVVAVGMVYGIGLIGVFLAAAMVIVRCSGLATATRRRLAAPKSTLGSSHPSGPAAPSA